MRTALLIACLLLTGCASSAWQKQAEKRFAAYDYAFEIVAGKVLEQEKALEELKNVDKR